MLKECRRIKANGIKCQSPAMRGSPFCYFHARVRVYVPARKPSGGEPLELPPLDNSAEIHAALHAVLEGLASSRVKPSAAGKLLYGLQLAQKSLEQRPFPTSTPTRHG
jgi:hypothetical protein